MESVDAETPLSDVLSGLVEDRLLAVRPGGNHGDALIYAGLEKLLRAAGIRWVDVADRVVGGSLVGVEGRIHTWAPRPFDWTRPGSVVREAILRTLYRVSRLDPSIDAVYVHGGGNFNDVWRNGTHCFRAAVRYLDVPVVVGPQSCLFDARDPVDLFAGVDVPVHFFCRGRYSYRVMEPVAETFENVRLYIAQDTALHLDGDDLPGSEPAGEYVLAAYRTDKESATAAGPPVPETDRPLVRRDVSVEAESLPAFVEAVSRAAAVHTDRLHVAILGAILEKPVTFYDNGYHKNRGVYDDSLADLPWVEFEPLR